MRSRTGGRPGDCPWLRAARFRRRARRQWPGKSRDLRTIPRRPGSPAPRNARPRRRNFPRSTKSRNRTGRDQTPSRREKHARRRGREDRQTTQNRQREQAGESRKAGRLERSAPRRRNQASSARADVCAERSSSELPASRLDRTPRTDPGCGEQEPHATDDKHIGHVEGRPMR